MAHDSQQRISLHPHDRRVQVWIDDTLIADSQRAIELHEKGYPPRQYLPREDVAMSRLVRTDTVTHCPFKGDASYYAIELDGKTVNDIAWSYEAPFDTVMDIRGYLAFDTTKLEQRLD
ncbi:MAG: DUF427 domain-containing protein [Halomonas sp.]|nr:DUF427 domain-containing protein [Halomonas sp.]